MKNGPVHIVNATHVRVLYRDTDQMGHAYYGNYLTWFEVGRVELLREMGQCYRQWEEEHGIFLPVKSCAVEYWRGAKYDEIVRIETHIHELTQASVTFHYRLFAGDTDELLAAGHTRHAFVTGEGRVARVAHRLLPECFS